jgi:CheY-like chemotaxis protein
MVRPCFLVIDREFPGSISTRKLVLETAKMNVITAYSAYEAVDTLTQYPAIDGVVIDADIYGMTCAELTARLRTIKPAIPVIVISGPGDDDCPGATYHVQSLDPGSLLDALRKLKPQDVATIEKHEERLNKKYEQEQD